MRREFVGIVLYASENDAAIARAFAASSDPKIVRYLSAIEAANVPRYKSEVSNFCVLELRWTSSEPNETEVAQLTDNWYYGTSHATSHDYPTAYGYRGIDRILDAYNMTLPGSHY
jgi:hypothetical protein